jgi:Holliday junction resolvasome RuvABC ATP-dependent DNA helicase subunit
VKVKVAEDSTGIGQAHAAFDAAFSDFIGNHQAIEKLRDDLVDALIKHPPYLPSAYLLTGNPSTGKTTLANKVAKLLGITFVKLVGTNVRSEADLVEQVDNAFDAAKRQPNVVQAGSQGLPEYEYPECLIFIDEIHLVKGRAQEGLLTLTEPKDRYVRLKDRICRFPRATYMAATTRDSEIDKALRTRFGNPIHLNDYTVQEVAQMLSVKKNEWAAWSEDIRTGLARLSRCIPREAERLAQKLERKMSVSREPLTIEGALEKLRLEEGLDRNGLDQVCWDMLRHLAKQARPLGRETLAKQLGGADEDKLVSEVIPALQSLGLVEQVAGGQKITDRGRNYLRNEAAPR